MTAILLHAWSYKEEDEEEEEGEEEQEGAEE